MNSPRTVCLSTLLQLLAICFVCLLWDARCYRSVKTQILFSDQVEVQEETDFCKQPLDPHTAYPPIQSNRELKE